MQIFVFLDTNMLVYPTQNFALGVLSNANPQCENIYVAVEYRLKLQEICTSYHYQSNGILMAGYQIKERLGAYYVTIWEECVLYKMFTVLFVISVRINA